MQKLNSTKEAQEVLDKLVQEHGALMFLISGGCCDGSAPLCMCQGEFHLSESDVLIGYVADCPVYVSEILSEHFNAQNSFFLDVAPGRGGGFSLEAPYDVRFINRGRY